MSYTISMDRATPSIRYVRPGKRFFETDVTCRTGPLLANITYDINKFGERQSEFIMNSDCLLLFIYFLLRATNESAANFPLAAAVGRPPLVVTHWLQINTLPSFLRVLFAVRLFAPARSKKLMYAPL